LKDDRFGPGIFDLRGIAPIGYVLVALALGGTGYGIGRHLSPEA
jgi:hypothetical protein